MGEWYILDDLYRKRKQDDNLFGFLSSVSTTSSHPVNDSAKVCSSTHELIPNTGQVLRPPTSNKNNAVFLQVVTFSLDVSLHRFSVRKLYARDLPFRGIGFFRFLDENLADDAFFGRVVLEEGGSWFFLYLEGFTTDRLVEGDEGGRGGVE